jgi:hypothetical protein
MSIVAHPLMAVTRLPDDRAKRPIEEADASTSMRIGAPASEPERKRSDSAEVVMTRKHGSAESSLVTAKR